MQWETGGKFEIHNVNLLKLNRFVTDTSVGESDFPCTDCRILDKFYENNVLWEQIECRFFNDQNVVIFVICACHRTLIV